MLSVALHDWDGRVPQLAAEIRRSPFQRVFLTVEERHVEHRAENVREAVAALKAAGLAVVLDPWAVGRIFAGEATSVGRDPWFQFQKWLELAATTEADAILIDEPDPRWDIADLIRAAAEVKPVILGLQPERDLAGPFFGVAEVAVSTYFFPKADGSLRDEAIVRDQIQRWHATLPTNASVWVQTWLIEHGQEWLPAFAAAEWLRLGRDVNVWSWDATATVSRIRPARPELVWDLLTTNVGALHRAA